MNARKDPEQIKAENRAEFYRIVKERLDSRLEKGEKYTTTSDLYRGYEPLHAEGFNPTVTPSQSVMQVLGYAEYRGRLFYARDAVTQKAERASADRYAPYRLYLRSDATPSTGHILVPIEVTGEAIGEYIAQAKGADDATVHVTETPVLSEPCETPVLDFQALADGLTRVVREQSDVIDTMLAALTALTSGQKNPAAQ